MAGFEVKAATGADAGEWGSDGNLRLVGYVDLANLSAAPSAPPNGRCRVYALNGQLQTADSDGATQLTAGAVSTSAVGTISGTTAAGAAPTVTITNCTDQRGNFLLNPVTGGGAQAAGEVALIRYARPYAAAPAAVLVTIENETDGTAAIVAAAADSDANGFDLEVGTALTTAKAYRVNYLVIP